MKSKIKFKEGKIIDTFFVEKEGKKMPIIIRYPKKSDLNNIWKFYNKVIKETPFLARMTSVGMKEEKKWFTKIFDDIKKKKYIYLIAEHDGKIIGSTTAGKKFSEVEQHVGSYGISILQWYAGLGIGTRLSENILRLAKEMKIEILELSVYSENKIAQGLYKKMGFKIAGKVPHGIKRGKKYMDNIFMYKVLKK
ncbi:MAG: GNAT family N-acetyltransferase [Candidatus Aenigmatarchaeota archaeon]